MSAFALQSLAQVAVDRTADDGANAAGWLFGLGGAIAVVVLLLFLAWLALIIWAIIDLVSNPRIDGTIKIVWAHGDFLPAGNRPAWSTS